jgi:hypothetical protein
MNLWPLRGGTWRERLTAAAFFLLLIGGWASFYILAWALSLYF